MNYINLWIFVKFPVSLREHGFKATYTNNDFHIVRNNRGRLICICNKLKCTKLNNCGIKYDYSNVFLLLIHVTRPW